MDKKFLEEKGILKEAKRFQYIMEYVTGNDNSLEEVDGNGDGLDDATGMADPMAGGAAGAAPAADPMGGGAMGTDPMAGGAAGAAPGADPMAGGAAGAAPGADPNAAYFMTALAFGLVIVAMAYSVGNVSGCHINPAVSIGMLCSGKMTVKEFFAYIAAQFIGGILGGLVLFGLLPGSGYGANGLYDNNVWASLLIEIILPSSQSLSRKPLKSTWRTTLRPITVRKMTTTESVSRDIRLPETT